MRPPVADRDRADERAVFPRPVLIQAQWMALAAERVEHDAHEWRESLGRRATHAQRAARAMQRAREIDVALELQEIWQAGGPVPAGRAERLPFVVIGRGAAIRHQRIDRGAAAEHARLLVATRRGQLAHARLQAYPEVARVEVGAARVAAAHLGRQACSLDVAAGLDEADRGGGVLGQPSGQHAAGRTTTQDQIVIHDEGRVRNAARHHRKIGEP